MSLVVLIPLLSLGLYLVPIVILRRASMARAQDYFVASEHTPPGVIQNSSIAYALKMATFGPFFAFGASGNVWPVLIAAACFALGLCAIFALRRPILAFLEQALSRDQSVTVHEFIARAHGNDSRLRTAAAGLTLLALAGLIAAEAVGLASVLRPVLPGDAAYAPVLTVGVLMLAGACTMLAGNSGVMRAAQSQLGLIYFGLIGATALLMYLQTSSLKQMPSYGTLAVFWVAVSCLLLIAYRRSRYVDTSPVRTLTPADGDDARRGSRGISLFRRFEKVLNVAITTLAVLVIVIAGMGLSSQGFTAALQESAAALQATPRISGMGLAALVVLPLIYPMVDIMNWQRLAAFEKSDVEQGQRPKALKQLFRIYAIESPLMWAFICMFGAIAAVTTTMPGDSTDAVQAFLRRLNAQPNVVAACAMSLLLIAVLAMALSAMSAAFSASLCTIRYDILPALRPELAPGEVKATAEVAAGRRTHIAGIGLGLVAAVVFILADRYLRVGFGSSAFLALVFALCCAQLAYAPLVLGPLTGGARSGGVRPAWALVILVAAAAAGVGAIALYLATGSEPWLWAAAPAGLAAGFVLFAVARVASTSLRGP